MANMTPEQIEAEYAHALGMKMRSGDKPLAVIEDGTIQSYSPRMMKLIEAMRAEMGRLTEYAQLLEQGLSASEARGTVWPDTARRGAP